MWTSEMRQRSSGCAARPVMRIGEDQDAVTSAPRKLQREGNVHLSICGTAGLHPSQIQPQERRARRTRRTENEGARAILGGMTEEQICEVVITAADAEWLAGFTWRLVEDRLAACGHQTAAIRSIYRWEGAVHDDPEARVALHTRVSLVSRIVERAGAEHPYDVPCVLAVPVIAGNPAYLAWVLAETA